MNSIVKRIRRSVVMLSVLLTGLNLQAQMGGSMMGGDNERSGMPMDPAAMREQCKDMKQHMQQTHERMERMDEELQTQVEAVDEAEGDAKIEAMAEAIRTLADQRHEMMEHRQRMMGQMMGHMGQHMMMKGEDGEKREMMMNCPMMQSSEKEGHHDKE